LDFVEEISDSFGLVVCELFA